MRRPFATNDLNMVVPASLPRVTTNCAGHLGGCASASQTVHPRRDFSFTPQFHPMMTITGGLKQPPRR